MSEAPYREPSPVAARLRQQASAADIRVTIHGHEEVEMKCGIQGCPGQYEPKKIVHTLQRGSDIFVFEHVPAEVCSVCGDTLLTPRTIKRLEDLLSARSKPGRIAPVYEYA